jgi:hypothetical protein
MDSYLEVELKFLLGREKLGKKSISLIIEKN